MKIKRIILLFVCVLPFVLFSQQEQQFTQYMINPYTINPALGGTEDFVDIKMGYRRQWVGLESSPKTYYLTGHTTLKKDYNGNSYHHKHEHKSWHGIGGYVYGDQTGPLSRNGFYLQYAYNFPLTTKLRMSVGTFIGLKNYKYDYSNLRREDFGDLAIPSGRKNKVLPDVNIGTWLYTKKGYLGGSIFQVLQNDIGIGSANSQGDSGGLVFLFFLTGGIRLPASEHVNFVRSFAIKSWYPAPTSLDINAKIDYDDKYFGALSYRVGDSFSAIVGTVINEMFEVSYSYDLTTSVLRKVSSGSHEIILGVRLKHKDHVICSSKFW